MSYAAYLWHMPVYLLLLPLIPLPWVRVPLAAALTVAMAYLSFRFVERSIRQWASRRLDPAVVRPAPEPARELELAGAQRLRVLVGVARAPTPSLHGVAT